TVSSVSACTRSYYVASPSSSSISSSVSEEDTIVTLILSQACAFFRGISLDRSSSLSYPSRSSQSALTVNPPFPLLVNSEGVVSLATTGLPSTSTIGLSPPIRLSSFFFGTYSEL